MRPHVFFGRAATAVLVLAALHVPKTSHAQFVALRVSWDDCAPPIVDKTNAIPGVNRFVVSATGLTPGITSARVSFVFRPYYVVPAWQFFAEDGFFHSPGCLGPSKLSIDQAGTSCPAAPLTSSSGEMVQSEFALTGPNRTVLRAMLGVAPEFAFDPATRYTLVRFIFDQSTATNGYDGLPGHCGGYDEPMCIAMGAQLGRIDQVPVAIQFDQQYLTWQDAGNGVGCPLAVPAQATTWGQIKSQYH